MSLFVTGLPRHGCRPPEARHPLSNPLVRARERRCARQVRELEERLRNPWRESKGDGGALEAWG